MNCESCPTFRIEISKLVIQTFQYIFLPKSVDFCVLLYLTCVCRQKMGCRYTRPVKPEKAREVGTEREVNRGLPMACRHCRRSVEAISIAIPPRR